MAQWLALSPLSNKVLGVSLDVALCVELVLLVSPGVSVSSQTIKTCWLGEQRLHLSQCVSTYVDWQWDRGPPYLLPNA